MTCQSGIDLCVKQGADYSEDIQLLVNGEPLTGTWLAECQIRSHATDSTILGTLTAVVSNSVLTLSAVAAETSSWSWTTAAHWDVLLTSDTGEKRATWRGRVTVDLAVTRP